MKETRNIEFLMGNLLRSDHFEFREENGSETLRWILDKL
jgi:hypothetical protein